MIFEDKEFHYQPICWIDHYNAALAYIPKSNLQCLGVVLIPAADHGLQHFRLIL